jgi:hypothetical protein
MRARIDSLESKYNKSLNLNKDLFDAQHTLERKILEWGDRIIRIAGPDSALALNIQIKATARDYDVERPLYIHPRRPFDPVSLDSIKEVEPVITAVLYQLETRTDLMDRKIFSIVGPDCKFSYAVNKDYIDDLRFDKRVVRDISDLIANELLTNIK